MAEDSDNSQERELDPTERRIERAREQGQLPQSKDITTLALLSGFILLIISAGPTLMTSLVTLTRSGLQFGKPVELIDHVQIWAEGPLLALVVILLAVLASIWLIAVFGPLSLVGFRAYFAPRFDLGRLDPIAGLGRLLSFKSVIELFKNLFKTVLVMGIGLAYLTGLFVYIRSIVSQDFEVALRHTSILLVNGFLLLLLPLLAIAVGDGWVQWFNFRKQIKMSPEEMKQEQKESEGSPEIKSRLRQKQRQMAASRMMSAIERADVVLANPDHYSVAIRYDSERMAAPIIVAKGMDEVALRIREIAREHDVPVAEVAPLARYLYSQLDIGEAVPKQLFEAVAKILAWAYGTKDGNSANEALPEVSFIPEIIKPGRPLI